MPHLLAWGHARRVGTLANSGTYSRDQIAAKGEDMRPLALQSALQRQRQRPIVAIVDMRTALSAIALLLIGTALTHHLTTWPTTWFDEGLNLSAAASLATTGVYGLPDSAGVRPMDPAIQTGPVVILPVAFAFKVFGVGLFQARFVMILFALGTLVAFALLAARLGGTSAALAATLLLLLGNGTAFTSFIPMSRQMLGEVTAVGCFCWACACLQRSIDRGQVSPPQAMQVGVLLGLGMVTKSQLVVVLPPTLAVVWVANRYYYRAMSYWVPALIGVTAVGCVVAWYGLQQGVAGGVSVRSNSILLREGFLIHIANPSLGGIRRALGVLWRTGFLFWGVPGLWYGLVLARQRSRTSVLHALLVAFISIWLGWFIFLSIAWDRYACVPLLLTPILSGHLAADWIAGRLRRPDRWTQPRRLAMATLIAGALFLILGRWQVVGMLGTQQTGAQQLISYLRQRLPADTVVETWAWEVSSFAPQQFHHPPTHVTNGYTLALWTNQTLPQKLYDPGLASPSYLIVGPFSDWTGIYDQYVTAYGSLVASFDDYALYRLHQP